jgi:hypothetical protein
VPILVGLMSPDSPASSSTRHQLLEVAASLVRGDPAAEAAGELLEGGLMEVLVELMGPEPLPRTQVNTGVVGGEGGCWEKCPWALGRGGVQGK